MGIRNAALGSLLTFHGGLGGASPWARCEMTSAATLGPGAVVPSLTIQRRLWTVSESSETEPEQPQSLLARCNRQRFVERLQKAGSISLRKCRAATLVEGV
jgi:hypothetical protein